MPRNALLLILLIAFAYGSFPASAQHESVVGTLHNLSISGPGEVRAVSESEVCRFCHIPHNPVAPVPLWSHKLSEAEYEVPDLDVSLEEAGKAPQPDGSSRLCLSCHDGTVALGDLGGRRGGVKFLGGDRLRPGQRGFIGTDLTGSHPISFRISEEPHAKQAAESADEPVRPRPDMGILPLSAVRANPRIKLDTLGRMQCTTCHDPHSDVYYEPGKTPRFWVAESVDEVCVGCHVLQ